LVLPWAVIHTGVVDKRWRTLQRVEAIVGWAWRLMNVASTCLPATTCRSYCESFHWTCQLRRWTCISAILCTRCKDQTLHLCSSWILSTKGNDRFLIAELTHRWGKKKQKSVQEKVLLISFFSENQTTHTFQRHWMKQN
jgi:hypothetical protein